MPTRSYNQNTYLHGSYNALCDICGFKFKSCDLRKNSDGYMVCQDDWEPEHPADRYRAPTETTSIPWARPEDAGQQIEGANTPVTKAGVDADTFPNAENTTATGQGTQPDSDGDGLVEGHGLAYDAGLGIGEAVDETVSKA